MANPNGKNNRCIADPKKTGMWLSDFLKRNNLLEHEVAIILGVSDQRVCNWAKGVRGMRLVTMLALCYIVAEPTTCDSLRKSFEELRG